MRAVEAPVVRPSPSWKSSPYVSCPHLCIQIAEDGTKELKWQIEKFKVELQSTDHSGGVAEMMFLDKDLVKVSYVENAVILEESTKDL